MFTYRVVENLMGYQNMMFVLQAHNFFGKRTVARRTVARRTVARRTVARRTVARGHLLARTLAR